MTLIHQQTEDEFRQRRLPDGRPNPQYRISSRARVLLQRQIRRLFGEEVPGGD